MRHLRVNRHLAQHGNCLLDAGSGPVQWPEYLTYSEGYRYRVCADISITALKAARHKLLQRGLYVVADIADDVVVMFRGEVVEMGPVESVLGNPRHPYTRALLDCVPDAEGRKPLKPIDYSWLNVPA